MSCKTLFVILSEVKNLMIASYSGLEILRLTPQNDIVGQNHRGEFDNSWGGFCFLGHS